MLDPMHATPVSIPAAAAAALAIESRQEYARVLGAMERWAPLVALICRVHGLSHDEITMGVMGTYPTCIVDRSHVVKLCGPWYGGGPNASAEVAAMRCVSGLAGHRAPALLAFGPLVGAAAQGWSYLVSGYCPGTPMGALADDLSEKRLCGLAEELGSYVRRVHDVDLPANPFVGERGGWARWISGQHAGLQLRLARRRTLPERWMAQAPGYVMPIDLLVEEQDRPRLVHSDITDDHVLLHRTPNGAMTWSLIDWGDARLGDPSYELPALFLSALSGNRQAFRSFLTGYGWRWDAAARWRAMTMVLLHEFDVLGPFVAERPALHEIADLDNLAEAIWAL